MMDKNQRGKPITFRTPQGRVRAYRSGRRKDWEEDVGNFVTAHLPLPLSKETSSIPAAAEQRTSSTETSDEALIGSICDGDAEALASLFRRYARAVRAVSYRVLRDTSEADDLLQDVFLLIHRLCTTFDSSKGPARFWILQMAYRRAISRRRYLTSRHFYTRLDLDDTASELADPRTSAGQLEASIDGQLGTGGVQKVFDTLSENQRQTLRLFFIEGYTLDEIAAKLGQSRGNVKHHYFRGLEQLRKELFGGKLPGERSV
jgi:RNA polymerase sigma-70 factor (ECF subfamily)